MAYQDSLDMFSLSYEDIRQISDLKKTKTYFKPRSRGETLREAINSKKTIKSWKYAQGK